MVFNTDKEKRRWVWVLLVWMAIFSTLFIGRPLIELFRNQDIQAVIFVLGMFLVGVTILLYALRTKPGKIEITVLLGFVAVYTMLILRLGLPERSHLIEYSVLAIFVHRAFEERFRAEGGTTKPVLYAFVFTALIGVLDEGLQYFLPDRVFDTNDIIFNSFAILTALGTVWLLNWIRNRKKEANSR